MADKDILDEALDAFKECAESRQATENRTNFLEDVRFARLGEQWPEQVKADRLLQNRPCLTTNFLPPVIRQVVNDCRQNKPSIKVHPADDVADPETAEIFSGLIRNIEQTSDADVAYDTGVDNAASGGFGYWRVNADYTTDDDFEQDLCIRRIMDPLSVFEDPYATAADSSDWNVAFVVERIPLERFKRDYQGAEEVSFDADGYAGMASPWLDGDFIQRAEYWTRDKTMRTILKLSDNSTVAEDVYTARKAEFDAAGVTVVGSRKVPSHKVTQRLLTGAEVLDKVDWVGKFIPIIPVYGEEVVVEGQRHFRSLIRDAKDPQRRFNYWDTTATELVALAPKAPFIGPKGAFKTDQSKWENANTQNYSYLEYDGAIPPQRQGLAQTPAAEIGQALRAHDDIKAVTGLYDASLGARSNETSGKAIMARQREGDTSTFHFTDNLARAIRHTGRILIDLIPHFYTEGRIIRVLGADGKPSAVPLGQEVPVMGPDGQPKTQPDGSPMLKVYDLGAGKYDLTVTAGPSFTSKREEAATQMIELIRAYPAAAPLIGDLLAKNLDWPGADEIAGRLKAMLPAQVRGENPETAQAQEQLKALQAELQKLAGELTTTKTDQANEAEKLKIDRYNAETARLKAEHPQGIGLAPETKQEIAHLILDVVEKLIDPGEEDGELPPMPPGPGPDDFPPAPGGASLALAA